MPRSARRRRRSCAPSRSATGASPASSACRSGTKSSDSSRSCARSPPASRWCGEVSDRTRARVMATGELMATHIGARFLAAQGLERRAGRMPAACCAPERHGASAKASVLSAVCGFAPDAALAARLLRAAPRSSSRRASSPATTRATPCCSAAAARIPRRPTSPRSCGAQRLEIWTDVPGMFSANPRATPDCAPAAHAALR